ncbi:MFS transporter [Chloroflexota bacterium]
MSLLLQNKDKIFYGWVIVAASLIIVTTLLGIRSSFGMFFKSIQGEFDLTRAATSSIFSAYTVFSIAFAVISGWALDRYGPRLVVCLMGLLAGLSLLATSQTNSFWQLFLGYSLLLSMGTTGTIPVLTSVISRWFQRSRGTALGIAISGIGLGTLVVSPVSAYLISNLDWRMSYVVMGLVTWLVVIPLAMLLRRYPGVLGVLPDGIKSGAAGAELTGSDEKSQLTGLSLQQAFRTRSFWLILSNWLFVGICQTIILIHVVPYATDIGIPAIQASTILSVIGGSYIISVLSVGRISDRVDRKVLGVICTALGAVALIWLTRSQELWMLYLFAITFGLAWGGISVINVMLVSEAFGSLSLGVIMGTLEVGFLAGSAIGAALGGFIFDVTGSYFIAFSIGAAAMLTIAVFITFIRREVNMRVG